MIVRDIEDIRGSRYEVDTPNWTSYRLLVARDNMGHSLHETVIRPGTETRMCYRHHLETVYCIGGSGEIEDRATGEIHPIRPGVLYALDRHDDHILRAGEAALRLICVFNPPVTGEETHDETGAYPPPAGAGDS